MRVNELAGELGIPSKELLAKLHALGVEVRSPMSMLDDAVVARIRTGDAPAPAEKPAKAPRAEKPVEKPAEKAAPTPEPLPEETPAKPPAPAKKPAKAAAAESAAKSSADAKGTSTSDLRVSDKSIFFKGPVVVKDLAEALGIKPHKLIAEMMSMNVLASINQRIDMAVARSVCEKHGFVLEAEKKAEEHKAPPKRKPVEVEISDRTEDQASRPPVVTFMGHVDHGKTSLLDKIRNAAVAKGEWGGITQHIGAYTLDVGGRMITFLDTPGHAAFTAMRARGANLTDITVIVIDGVDGVMPQTKEAISHAQAAKVALMVAINKIDLPNANPDHVKQQLQAMGLAPEDWGGQVICCPVSAVTGKGIDHLLEMILLQAEMLELKANPRRRAEGYVVEAQMEAGMGPTATLLVKNGTLKVGDTILCGQYCGKVRALMNDHGIKVKNAGPAMAVKCLGLPGVPEAGADFKVFADEKEARALAATRSQQARLAQATTAPRKMSLDDLFGRLQADEAKLELKIILKADTQGSIEAIVHALQDIRSEKVQMNLILSSTGNITTNDVMLASASDAVILGFHVAREPGVDAMARHEGVDIRLHQIIYELLDQVRDAMSGLLSPIINDKIMGHARVIQVFPIGKKGKAAGCRVIDGSVTPKFRVRVKRNSEVLCEGTIDSLRRQKDQVSEVRESQECGIRLDKSMDFAEGDILEFYVHEEIQQTL